MIISTFVCGSCAVNSIDGLGSHANAISAMKAFCSKELGRPGPLGGVFGVLTCYYVFCAGPEVPKDHPNGSHHSKAWVRYGTEFAQFILDNGLGEVATVGPKYNTKYHSTTTAQVWVWSPNQAALEAWWLANIPATEKQYNKRRLK